MSKLVNLNQVRKARARAEGKARAEDNSLRFGRSKAEKELDKARAAKAREKLDQTRREE